MNKKERVQAALLSKNLDRPPISLWMNYPEVDQEPLSLAKANIQAGAAGIFFATACAKHNLLSNTEYNEFARYYDFEVLRGARGGWFNNFTYPWSRYFI